MDRPNQEKELVLSGKSFRIKKFTPEAACYWASRLFAQGLNLAKLQGSFSVDKLLPLIQDFLNMDRARFAELQKDALSRVMIKLESGLHPFVHSDGFYADPDLPAPIIGALTFHSFMFSMQDFLDPALLATLTGELPEAPTTQATTGQANSSISQ